MYPAGVKTTSKRRKAAAKSKQPKAKQRAVSKHAAVTRRFGPRADFGAPIESFFARQPAQLREILDALKKLVEKAAPDAKASLKWGMPFYTIDGAMFCALGGHKSHVNLILAGPPGAFADPEKRLSGGGKTGRHLKLTSIDELPRDAVRGWLGTAAKLAKKSRDPRSVTSE